LPKQVLKFTGVIQGINFEVNSDKLTKASLPVLDKALAVLKEFADIRLEIQGHTSAAGDDASNLDLSQRRAASVAAYFMSKGVDGARLVAKGYAETQPIAPDDAAGRKKNRRVEFKLIVDDVRPVDAAPATKPAPDSAPATESKPAEPTKPSDEKSKPADEKPATESKSVDEEPATESKPPPKQAAGPSGARPNKTDPEREVSAPDSAPAATAGHRATRTAAPCCRARCRGGPNAPPRAPG
jgi:outer membrane biosynthesis protein TonB